MEDSLLYSSPTMFRMNPRPFSSSTPYNVKSTFPSVDAFSSVPVMMSRDDSNLPSTSGSEEMIIEEIVTEEVVLEEVVRSDNVSALLDDNDDEEISF